MKKTTLALLVILAGVFCSCKNEERTLVMLKFDGFSVEQENIKTDAQTAGINILVVSVYDENNTKVFEEGHYLGADVASFEQFAFTLIGGTYTVVAVGYKGDVNMPYATFTNKNLMIIENDRALMTYYGSNTLTIEGGGAQSLSMPMRRAVAAFRLQSTTPVPDLGNEESVFKLRFSFSAGSRKKLDPITGLAAENVAGTAEIVVSETMRVSPSPYWTAYTFLNTDVQNMNISVEAIGMLGATLYRKDFDNIELKRNRRTVATGAFYPGAASSNFSFDTSWLSSENISF